MEFFLHNFFLHFYIILHTFKKPKSTNIKLHNTKSKLAIQNKVFLYIFTIIIHKTNRLRIENRLEKSKKPTLSFTSSSPKCWGKSNGG
jgi:hypothetical protein